MIDVHCKFDWDKLKNKKVTRKYLSMSYPRFFPLDFHTCMLFGVGIPIYGPVVIYATCYMPLHAEQIYIIFSENFMKIGQ